MEFEPDLNQFSFSWVQLDSIFRWIYISISIDFERILIRFQLILFKWRVNWSSIGFNRVLK